MNPNHHAGPPPAMPRLKDLALRDLFAMAALAGEMANAAAVGARHREIAAQAYEIADAMLKVRKEGR